MPGEGLSRRSGPLPDCSAECESAVLPELYHTFGRTETHVIQSILTLFGLTKPRRPEWVRTGEEPPPPACRFEPEADDLAWWHEQTRRP